MTGGNYQMIILISFHPSTFADVFNKLEFNLKSATLLKSQSVAAQTAKNAIFLVWTDFLPCVG